MKIYSRAVTVSVPATSANLGPGFDCLGLALDLRNEVTAARSGPDLPCDGNETEYVVAVEGVDAEKVPVDRRNLVIAAAETLFREVGRRPALCEIRLLNRIPVGSGLGSSSSAVVAGLIAANALIDGGLSPDDLLKIAVAIEGHPDNVAPAMLGGLVLGVLPDVEYGPTQLVVRRMEPPRLSAVVVLPDYQLLTAEARAVLPPTVTRAEAIFNTSRLGLLLHALTAGDYDCLRVAMGDRLHQTHRMKIIPGAANAYEAAYAAGAMGVALSGAGPSLIAFTDLKQEAIAQAMLDAFAGVGLGGRSWILQPSKEGAHHSVVEP
jgi:homoserine kinase